MWIIQHFFQEINIPAVISGSLIIIFQKCFKSFGWNLAGFYPLINREIPGVLTFLTSINQPDINVFSVGVYPELTGIHKLLLFPTTSAAVKMRIEPVSDTFIESGGGVICQFSGVRILADRFFRRK